MKPPPRITPDQTLSQLPKDLEAAKVEDGSVNRLLKIHEAAQQVLRDLEADFQIRLQESIQQTEAKLKQRFADEQEQKIRQTEEGVRKATTRELLARFDVDFRKLSSEFEQRRQSEIAATENAAQLRLKEVLGEAERASEDLKRQLADANQRFQRTSDEFDAERSEFHQQIASLEKELARSKEIAQQVIRTPLSRELEAKLEEVRGEKARLEEELREANARGNAAGQSLETTQAARYDTRDVSEAVKAEIARIEARSQEITQKIGDSSTDLGTQIRLDRERSELAAYLKGLRYSIGEITFDNQT